jgi:hypothetical protein
VRILSSFFKDISPVQAGLHKRGHWVARKGQVPRSLSMLLFLTRNKPALQLGAPWKRTMSS